MKPEQISEWSSFLKDRLNKNEPTYIKVALERNPNGTLLRLTSVQERGLTVDWLGHQWFFEWFEVIEIY